MTATVIVFPTVRRDEVPALPAARHVFLAALPRRDYSRLVALATKWRVSPEEASLVVLSDYLGAPPARRYRRHKRAKPNRRKKS